MEAKRHLKTRKTPVYSARSAHKEHGIPWQSEIYNFQ
jgi:hypothetical protein